MTKSNPTIKFSHAVTGDFSRMVYSRHRTHSAAQSACAQLNKKWGISHPGSEARVVALDATNQTARHIGGGN